MSQKVHFLYFPITQSTRNSGTAEGPRDVLSVELESLQTASDRHGHSSSLV